eukprot:755796-Hanusia_phi.AAC.6
MVRGLQVVKCTAAGPGDARTGDGQISYAEFRGLVKLLEQERGGLRPKGYEPRRELMQGDIPPASVKSRKGFFSCQQCFPRSKLDRPKRKRRLVFRDRNRL